jgi:CBS domain containing-hemolysin-like protein
MLVTPVLVVVVLTLFTALYVAAEFGAVSVRRSRVRQLAEDGHRLAIRLLPIVESPRTIDRYIAASQIGITLTSLIIGAYGQATITPVIEPYVAQLIGWDAMTTRSISQVSVLLTLTIFNVIIGELVPKSVALQYPTQTALYTVLPMQWSVWVYSGFIGFLNGSGLLLLRLLGIRQTGHRHVHSPDELELLIAESRDGGLLEPDEHRRLQRALRLRLRTARQLMTPRDQIEAIDVEAPLEQALALLDASPYTLLPAYRGTLDRLVGTINTKKLALRLLTGGRVTSIASLLGPVVTVSEEVCGDRLLSLFRERRTHQVVVIDAQNRVIGLVTLEGVLTGLLDDVPAPARQTAAAVAASGTTPVAKSQPPPPAGGAR